jgi:hypothetical protein
VVVMVSRARMRRRNHRGDQDRREDRPTHQPLNAPTATRVGSPIIIGTVHSRNEL